MKTQNISRRGIYRVKCEYIAATWDDKDILRDVGRSENNSNKLGLSCTMHRAAKVCYLIAGVNKVHGFYGKWTRNLMPI